MKGTDDCLTGMGDGIDRDGLISEGTTDCISRAGSDSKGG